MKDSRRTLRIAFGGALLALALLGCDEISIIKLNARLFSVEAQTELAARYAAGNGVPKDMEQAALWYRKAADHGYPEAQLALGLLYAKGEGLPRDPVEAARLFRLAAEQGNPYAQLELGMCYFDGRGVDADLVEAHKWIHVAAIDGISPAFGMLAQIEQRLDPAQIAEARRRARAFQADEDE